MGSMAYENTLEYIVNKVWERYRLYDGSEDNTMKERQMILRTTKAVVIIKKPAAISSSAFFNTNFIVFRASRIINKLQKDKYRF